MKGIIEIKMVATHHYGASPSSVWMFQKQIEFHPTLRDWITFIETDLLHLPEIGNIKPTHLKQIETDTFSSSAELCIPTSKDDVEYYRSLIQDGWSANYNDAHLIRERGYTNFKPEHF